MQRHGRYIPSQLKFLWDQGKGLKKKKEPNKEQGTKWDGFIAGRLHRNRYYEILN